MSKTRLIIIILVALLGLSIVLSTAIFGPIFTITGNEQTNRLHGFSIGIVLIGIAGLILAR